MANNSEKRRFFDFHVARGRVQVRLRPVREDPALSLPEHLHGGTFVSLNFSHKFGTPLSVTDMGITQHLSFGKNGQYTVQIPWECVYYIEGEDHDGTAPYLHWPDEDPTFQAFEDGVASIPPPVAPTPRPGIYSKEMATAKKVKNQKVQLTLLQGGVAKGEPLPNPPVRNHLRLVKDNGDK